MKSTRHGVCIFFFFSATQNHMRICGNVFLHFCSHTSSSYPARLLSIYRLISMYRQPILFSSTALTVDSYSASEILQPQPPPDLCLTQPGITYISQNGWPCTRWSCNVSQENRRNTHQVVQLLMREHFRFQLKLHGRYRTCVLGNVP